MPKMCYESTEYKYQGNANSISLRPGGKILTMPNGTTKEQLGNGFDLIYILFSFSSLFHYYG